MQNSLIDTFGRRISYLRISVTDRCNLRCTYCSPLLSTLPREKLLSFEEILRIVRVSAQLGISKYRLTGGEPLLRKNLQSLIASIASVPGVQDLSLTTNGVLLKKYAKELRSAGLRRINVSLDTLNEDKFKKLCGMEGVHQVLEGLEYAREAGIAPIKVNTVVIKDFNDDEVVDFVKLAKERGWKQRFIELMPFGNAESSKFISGNDIKTTLVKYFEVKELSSDGGVANRFLVDGKTEIGIISPLSDSFCNDCNRLRLTADGKLRGCLMKESEVDIQRVLKNGCDDNEIVECFLEAVQLKPRGHEFHRTGFRKCARPMNTIGG